MKSSKYIVNHFKILVGMTPRTTKKPIRLIPYYDYVFKFLLNFQKYNFLWLQYDSLFCV